MKRRQRVRHTDIAYCTSYYTAKGLEKIKEQATSQGYMITRVTVKYEQGIKYSKLWVLK